MPLKLIKSFTCASRGLLYILKTQRNMRIHFIIAIGVMILSFLLKVPYAEMAILALAILMVFMMEMINTAIEEAVNLRVLSHRSHARLAKDIAAGGVLVSSIGAVMIGFLILGERILNVF